jgi:hypothetical protein
MAGDPLEAAPGPGGESESGITPGGESESGITPGGASESGITPGGESERGITFVRCLFEGGSDGVRLGRDDDKIKRKKIAVPPVRVQLHHCNIHDVTNCGLVVEKGIGVELLDVNVR